MRAASQCWGEAADTGAERRRRARRRSLTLLGLAALVTACGAPRAPTIMPLAAATDSVSARVLYNLWQFYAQSGRPPRPEPKRECHAALFGEGPPEACVARLALRAEDSGWQVATLAHMDSLAQRRVALRDSVGPHALLDETRFFAYAWRRDRRALDVPLDACAAGTWTCDAMHGMLHHRLGDIVAAEQHFAHMLAAMPTADACHWRMLPLLARDRCGASDPATDSLMWSLGDPLWLEAGNDRWTEHLARQVLTELFLQQRHALSRGRFSGVRTRTNSDRGAEASRVRSLRYGIFTVAVWADSETPYWSRGFEDGRAATLWDLVAPRYEFLPLEPARYREVRPTDSMRLGVWPAGHWAGYDFQCYPRNCLTRPGAPMQAARRMHTSGGRVRTVVQPGMGHAESYGRGQAFDRVRDFQVVTLPRDTGRQRLAAFRVGPIEASGPMGVAFSRGPTDPPQSLLATDTAPGVVRVAGRLPRDGGVISLEAVTSPRQVYRHRYYLAEDSASAVSPIVLLAGDSIDLTAGTARTLHTELPLTRMLPRTWLDGHERVVLNWEVAASLAPAASHRVALELRRLDRSTWGRVGDLFRAGPDERTVRVVPGPLAPLVETEHHVGYGLPFALRTLEPGEYEVRAVATDAAPGREQAGPAVRFTLRAARPEPPERRIPAPLAYETRSVRGFSRWQVAVALFESPYPWTWRPVRPPFPSSDGSDSGVPLPGPRLCPATSQPAAPVEPRRCRPSAGVPWEELPPSSNPSAERTGNMQPAGTSDNRDSPDASRQGNTDTSGDATRGAPDRRPNTPESPHATASDTAASSASRSSTSHVAAVGAARVRS
jgi:hypothetical protein